jgi:hypothetical protein
MKKKYTVTFTNKDSDPVSVCFEPNGFVLPLPPNENIELTVTSDDTPLKIDFQKQDGVIYVTFWEEIACEYSARYKGKPVSDSLK